MSAADTPPAAVIPAAAPPPRGFVFPFDLDDTVELKSTRERFVVIEMWVTNEGQRQALIGHTRRRDAESYWTHAGNLQRIAYATGSEPPPTPSPACGRGSG